MGMKKEEKKRFVRLCIISCAIVLLCTTFVAFHCGVVHEEGSSAARDIMNGIKHLGQKPTVILPVTGRTFEYMAIFAFFGLLVNSIIMLGIWKRHYDKDATGTASFNEDLPGYNRDFTDPKGDPGNDGHYNAIFTKNVFLGLDGDKTYRNSNAVIVGGPGSGKSRFFCFPNGLQMNGSYIFTDPKGELLEKLGVLYEDNGYEVKVFNLKNMAKSLTYNPFVYIKNDDDVMVMIDCLVQNLTKSKGGGDPFWEESMKLLISSVVYYLREVEPPEKQNFTQLLYMVALASEGKDGSGGTEFAQRFARLKELNPKSMAVKTYQKLCIAPEKTMQSIFISVTSKLQMFDTDGVANLTSTDEMHLEEIGRKRQALFIITPVANDTYNFIAATLYTQLFQRMYHDAEDVYNKAWLLRDERDVFLIDKDKERIEKKAKALLSATIKKNDTTGRYEIYDEKEFGALETFRTEYNAKWWLERARKAVGNKLVKCGEYMPYYVRMVLDEFPNIGTIPGFLRILATVRSYHISCLVIVQHIEQISSMYNSKEDMNTLIGQCDSFLYLGSNEKTMIEYMVGALGKTTKISRSRSLNGKGDSESRQVVTTDLMPYDQMRELDGLKCIYMLKGVKPFIDDKYDVTEHPNYKKSGLYDDSKKFEIPFDNSKKVDVDVDTEIVNEARIELGKKYKNRIITVSSTLEDTIAALLGDNPMFSDDVNGEEIVNVNEITGEIIDPEVKESTEIVSETQEIVEEKPEEEYNEQDPWDVVGDMMML